MSKQPDEHWNGRRHVMDPAQHERRLAAKAPEVLELLRDVAAHSAGDPGSQDHSDRAKALLATLGEA